MNLELTDLLDAGVHFGHQVKRWNPKSKDFIFDHRQGISIIDLTKSYEGLKRACEFVENTVADGGEILLVGTKRQAQEIVREAAAETGMPYCANRWLGGTLTNWQTITRSVAKYKNYQKMEADGVLAKMHKKESSAIRREMERMRRNFEGIVAMEQLPAAIFIVDINYEDIAVAEARRCKIPLVGIVDSNSDPSLVDYPIPGNDDAVKSIRIVVEAIAEAIQSGLSQRSSRRQGDADQAGQEMVEAAAAEGGGSSEVDEVTPRQVAAPRYDEPGRETSASAAPSEPARPPETPAPAPQDDASREEKASRSPAEAGGENGENEGKEETEEGKDKEDS